MQRTLFTVAAVLVAVAGGRRVWGFPAPGFFGAVVLFVVFFSLCEGAGIGQKLRAVWPRAEGRLDRLSKVMTDVRSYLLVKSFTSLVAALATWLVLDSFNLPLATLLGITMFV